MSTFIKFQTDEMTELQKEVKDLRNKLIDTNSSTIEVKRNIRDKREMLNQAFLHANEAHRELAKIISLMPSVDSAPLKVPQNRFFISGDHHNALVKLSDKISKLR